MKFCQKHWDKLRSAITERGLFHLVSDGGLEAGQKLVDELKTRETNIQNFDPLMAAHNQIFSNAMKRLGVGLLVVNEDGTHKCPLCELGKHCDKCRVEAEKWIDYASDGVKQYYDENLASNLET